MTGAGSEGGEAAAMVADELLRACKVMRIKLDGLRVADSRFADDLAERLVGMLVGAGPARGARDQAPPLQLVPELSGDIDIEDFIAMKLRDTPAGLSVEQIFSDVEEAGYDVRRPTLVVRLHRMAASGKLVSPARGHYRLPDAEPGRTRGARAGL